MNRRKKIEKERGEDGTVLMSKANIRQICEEDNLYELPDLNSKLYLHFKGFRKIEWLDEYINVKVLWLENNLLTKIEGLTKLSQLTHLYVQNNLIEEIEGLEENSNLLQFNLSSNRIKRVQNITHLTQLQNLNLELNQIESAKDIEEIIQNIGLTTLDLQSNLLKLEQDEQNELPTQSIIEPIDNLLKIFMQMKDIRCIYLQNNEYIRDVLHFRKIYIGNLPNLTYLDNKPVSNKERTLFEAFVQGGKQCEDEVKQKMDLQDEVLRQKTADEVRKTIPQHLVNKIAFFEKTLKNIPSDLDAMWQQRISQVSQGCNQDQLDYTDEQITKKQLELIETQTLLDNMRQRAGISNIIKQKSSNQPNLQQNQKHQQDFDELD